MQKTTPERAKNSSAPSPALLAAGVGVWQLASPAHSAEEDFCCSLHHHNGKTEERQHGKCPQNHQKQLWVPEASFLQSSFSQGELLSAPCFWCGGHRRAPRGRSASDPGSRCTGAITCPRLRATLLANWSGRRISIKKKSSPRRFKRGVSEVQGRRPLSSRKHGVCAASLGATGCLVEIKGHPFLYVFFFLYRCSRNIGF